MMESFLRMSTPDRAAGRRTFTGRAIALIIAGLLVVAASMASCSGTKHSPPSHSSREAQGIVFKTLKDRTKNLDSIYFADDLGDYLPTQTVRIDDGSTHQLSPGVIIGNVVAADVSAAYSLPSLSEQGDTEPEGVKVAVDSIRADWRVVTFTIAVDRAWSNVVEAKGNITVDLAIGGSDDARTFVQGLESLNSAVVVLDGTDHIGDARFAVAQNGALLGVLTADGIKFPALTREAEADFIEDLTTPTRVSTAAKQPQPVIVVERGVVVEPGD